MVFNSPTCLAKCERIPSVSFWPFPAFALLSFSRFVLVVLFWWFRFGRFVSVVSFWSFRWFRSYFRFGGSGVYMPTKNSSQSTLPYPTLPSLKSLFSLMIHHSLRAFAFSHIRLHLGREGIALIAQPVI